MSPTPDSASPAGPPVEDTDIRAASGPKRGGGPPGGSAFNRGGRLRRISARPAGTLTPDRQSETAPKGVARIEAAPSAFLPAEAPSTPATSGAGPRSSTSYASLPFLGIPAGAEPLVQFVGTAFVRAHPEESAPEQHSGFDEYFTFESLFEEPPEADLSSGHSDDPYDILGITPSTGWDEVISVKRRLVKQHHPDHLSEASCEERSAAEERLRLINWAYTQIRADHGR